MEPDAARIAILHGTGVREVMSVPRLQHPQRRCAFVRLYGLIGAMIAAALLGVSLLMTLASGLQVWLSQNPAWPWFKASLAALLCSLTLMAIMLGKEFHWWYVDGKTLDHLAMAWIGVTLIGVLITYWLAR
jgi:hypothetical protein